MLLGNLDNAVYFKKVFTDVEVFTAFVKDVVGIDIDIDVVETEKVLLRQNASIRFKMDLFAETKDHRVIVEIQKVDYDHNYNRFIHYFLSNLIDQQTDSATYSFAKEVYTVILVTAPYRISEKNGQPIKDDVLLATLNPQTLGGQVREMYGHKLIFLNPNYTGPDTPKDILDWMNLIQESIKHPRNPQINFEKPAIRRAAALAEMDGLSPEELYEAKNEESRRETIAVVAADAVKEATIGNIERALRIGKQSKEDIAELFEVTLDFVSQVESRMEKGLGA